MDFLLGKNRKKEKEENSEKEKNGNEIRVSVVGDVNNIKMPHEIQLEENRKIISEYRRIAYRHKPKI